MRGSVAPSSCAINGYLGGASARRLRHADLEVGRPEALVQQARSLEVHRVGAGRDRAERELADRLCEIAARARERADEHGLDALAAKDVVRPQLLRRLISIRCDPGL